MIQNQLIELLLRSLVCACLVCAAGSVNAQDESGPDVVPIAQAVNPKPDELPSLRVVKEKLWGKHFPMLSMTFPNVPAFQCDAWCYEADVEFLDARQLDGGAVEFRHRDKQHPQALVITTATPKPGSVEIIARVELDAENHVGEPLPDAPPGLNLCWQLRHSKDFASADGKYPEFVKRCFIFTDRGRTFLLDTKRTKIPVQAADHEYNNPPWVQSYIIASKIVPVTPTTSWAGYSPDRYLTPVIGTVSRDGKYLTAIANDSTESMAQAWHDCMHSNPDWLPADAPIGDKRWRLVVYAMENDPKKLLERVAQDFPREKRLVAAAEPPKSAAGWKAIVTRAGWLEIPESATWLTSLPLGPFVRLADNGILGVDRTNAIVSYDEGVSWESRPLFSGAEPMEVRPERAMLRTASGAIVLVFMNDAVAKWGWDKQTSSPAAGTHLPVRSIRSIDDGKTWIDNQVIYDGYSGDIHSIIQTRDGHIVAPVQELIYEEGRHALRPQWSVDDGKTWQRGNLLDIGGRGHHDGLIEGTLEELSDGRVWMLCRTNFGRFWSAFSMDSGKYWRVLQPSDIIASSSPGALKRLTSGKLLLIWNRTVRDDGQALPESVFQGGDKQWSEVRANNFRAELSAALSGDDGKTWSKPVVIARSVNAPGASLAYTYIFEHQPGKLWITTMQGDVRILIDEAELDER
jgi:sialidase-1